MIFFTLYLTLWTRYMFIFLYFAAFTVRQRKSRVLCQPTTVLLRRFQRSQAELARSVFVEFVPGKLTRHEGPLFKYNISLFDHSL